MGTRTQIRKQREKDREQFIPNTRRMRKYLQLYTIARKRML